MTRLLGINFFPPRVTVFSRGGKNQPKEIQQREYQRNRKPIKGYRKTDSAGVPDARGTNGALSAGLAGQNSSSVDKTWAGDNSLNDSRRFVGADNYRHADQHETTDHHRHQGGNPETLAAIAFLLVPAQWQCRYISNQEAGRVVYHQFSIKF
jgi:hypothetical protein